ncbi:hypothetical protein COY00_03990 [Candidatus Pacearchaeota archaeon CG_4_10_14_0_2_um_filter_35_33]|nr:MAG: hypothetical protein AUJ63_04995 [Candidatus Pacearchaeota archaeon CG1_02_35_32]PIY81175.1 MAG: hypothetical protein COY79_03985 [Candidatus Pacearchaeota archaeon CG_4_10_14_0_8_um_filter_35_169]PIZ79426.1 MAG: hypothetical protein COY00_03990 [Candidatus Pacearchaeota archaeon CG_4_10_14_0_2_um_filter_35_33]PJB93990.1 MAG: hypothetical protein CO081_03515 [Candidatus Pacearchaeota archaeon CG_4_9_14_0_8_um_filter_35_24]
MRIAIDLDDVLADSLTTFIEFYNSNHQDKLKYEDFTSYTLNEINGTPKEEENKLLADFDNSPYFQDTKPMLKSQEAVMELSKKHELIIVTSRTLEKEEKTKAWLKKYFPEITKVYFTRHNYEASQKTKAEICEEIGADILIEDRLKYAKQTAEAGIKVLLFNYPWNQTKNLNSNIQRVKDWDEILTKLR